VNKKLLSSLAFLLVAAAVFSTLGCGTGPTVSFDNGKEVSTLHVEVADTPGELERGLMDRAGLPSDSGMLFDFGGEVETAFWMKNTSIPLSIAFIDPGGKVLAIKDMVPYDLAAVRPPGEYRYAVEANRGWFGEHSIHPGDRATITL
jgi:uncharacterized membrane protein (UPF0127 family)